MKTILVKNQRTKQQRVNEGVFDYDYDHDSDRRRRSLVWKEKNKKD